MGHEISPSLFVLIITIGTVCAFFLILGVNKLTAHIIISDYEHNEQRMKKRIDEYLRNKYGTA